MIPGFPRSGSDYIETPNLARLAQSGMRFGHAYAPAAMCSPTRYGIQYGRTPAALLKTDNYGPSPESFERLATSQTLPQILKKCNPEYATAHLGKWHIHGTPEELGYDRSDGPTGNSTGNKNIPPDDPKLIFSLTRRANDFMKEQVETGKPFYLQVSHYAVHLALMALQETQETYKNKPPGTYHKRPMFGACTQDLDTGLGMLLDMVEKLGIKDNTYIFFMSDNGALAVHKEMRMVNMPLRRGKFSLFEGGIRVPFIACGPGIAGNSI
jgi:arylsulfatase A-like enzyme